MMSPLQFETLYQPLWRELESGLAVLEGLKKVKPAGKTRKERKAAAEAQAAAAAAAAADAPPAARVAALYRRACEHLALARERQYPLHITERLASLTERAHRLIYRRHDYGLGALGQLLLYDFPQAVRRERRLVLLATLLFGLPMLALGWACWRDPGFILGLMDAGQVRQFDIMYADSGDVSIGHQRSAQTDWQMFGFYIMHNVGIAFQCFAGGVLAGLGSVFFLIYNGLFIGAVGGYLVSRGHSLTFFSFVVTHSAFELTAIVLSGACGLRLGVALLSPGRLGRVQALRAAANSCVVIVYGLALMLLVAAGLEAFWSSARWVAPWVKFTVGGCAWALVLAYFAWQGRPRADAPRG